MEVNWAPLHFCQKVVNSSNSKHKPPPPSGFPDIFLKTSVENGYLTIALFRLSVMGSLASRERLERGELQTIIGGLAGKEYAIPGSDQRFLGEKTIEACYYTWRAHGSDGLIPQQRTDRGVSKLPVAVQEALLAAKRENPRRSIRQLKILLENAGIVPRDTLSLSASHRFFCSNKAGRARRVPSILEEHRRFVAEYANSIWYGDVMHGPTLTLKTGRCKVFLDGFDFD